jgi:hypothetical protein
MSLRVSLVLVIAACWVAIGASIAVKQLGQVERAEQPPFFFTLSPDDLRHISIWSGEHSTSWHFREDDRRWYFDDEKDVPASLYRWGGITQLLGGPRSQRELKKAIDDPELYGLDDPQLSIRVRLRDDRELTVEMGDLTPDGGANYARQSGYEELYTVDYSWGEVMLRLVEEPPYPDWFYTMDPTEATEVLLFEGNEVSSGYAIDEESGDWVVCDLPAVNAPCHGSTPADGELIGDYLSHFGAPAIDGAEVLNLTDFDAYEPYGVGRDAPYVHIRREVQVRELLTEVYRTSMIIGDVTPDGNYRYAVANETQDIIRVDKAWADKMLTMFELQRE